MKPKNIFIKPLLLSIIIASVVYWGSPLISQSKFKTTAIISNQSLNGVPIITSHLLNYFWNLNSTRNKVSDLLSQSSCSANYRIQSVDGAFVVEFKSHEKRCLEEIRKIVVTKILDEQTKSSSPVVKNLRENDTFIPSNVLYEDFGGTEQNKSFLLAVAAFFATLTFYIFFIYNHKD